MQAMRFLNHWHQDTLIQQWPLVLCWYRHCSFSAKGHKWLRIRINRYTDDAAIVRRLELACSFHAKLCILSWGETAWVNGVHGRQMSCISAYCPVKKKNSITLIRRMCRKYFRGGVISHYTTTAHPKERWTRAIIRNVMLPIWLNLINTNKVKSNETKWKKKSLISSCFGVFCVVCVLVL